MIKTLTRLTEPDVIALFKSFFFRYGRKAGVELPYPANRGIAFVDYDA
jgi:hypothetical protein